MRYRVLRADADRSVGADEAYQAGDPARSPALCRHGEDPNRAPERWEPVCRIVSHPRFAGCNPQSPSLNKMVAAIPAQTGRRSPTSMRVSTCATPAVGSMLQTKRNIAALLVRAF